MDRVELARLVSNVTRTMCGVVFELEEPAARGDSICVRMLSLELVGLRRTRIVLSCDATTASNLAASLLRRPAAGLRSVEIDGAMRDLLNMVAGQVANCLGMDQTLGAIQSMTLAELSALGASSVGGSVLLHGSASADLRLWIFELVDSNDSGPLSAVTPRSTIVRRIFRRPGK